MSDSGDNSAGAIFRVPQKGKPDRVPGDKLSAATVLRWTACIIFW